MMSSLLLPFALPYLVFMRASFDWKSVREGTFQVPVINPLSVLLVDGFTILWYRPTMQSITGG